MSIPIYALCKNAYNMCGIEGNGGYGMKMTEVVEALIWDKDKLKISQRPPEKERGLLWEFVGGKLEPP